MKAMKTALCSLICCSAFATLDASAAMRFAGMDANNDGIITRSEWQGSSTSFRTHDRNRDGILSGTEVYDDKRTLRFENLDINEDNRISRGEWNGNALINVRDVFESHADDTEASRLAFGRDGMIYLSISAPGSPDVRRSQDPGDYAGKVVRLRDDGSIPSDNPFVNRSGYLPGIFTLGHRNGHGVAVNPETGEVWSTEQGPSGGDEVNILRAGKNYGWPFLSYGRNYSGSRIAERPSLDGFEDPAVVWLPSIGITGMTFYTGNAFPHWRRNLFVAGLRQGGIPRTGHIERIVYNERWEELRRESLLGELKQRMRDVRQGPDGALYVLTAEEDGALLRIQPR